MALGKLVSEVVFNGRAYPGHCRYCKDEIGAAALVLLGTDLIFCDEDCTAEFIRTRAADITISEGESKCMIN